MREQVGRWALGTRCDDKGDVDVMLSILTEIAPEEYMGFFAPDEHGRLGQDA